MRAYARRLLDVLGWRFLVFLAVCQLIGKGTLYVLANAIMMPLFKGRGVDAAQLQLFEMFVMIPWSTKPLLGLASDVLVVFGYHKRPWLVLGAVVGTLAAAGLLLFADSVSHTAVMVACFAGLQFQVALFDLLSEAKYVLYP
jgi:hypothetical protein